MFHRGRVPLPSSIEALIETARTEGRAPSLLARARSALVAPSALAAFVFAPALHAAPSARLDRTQIPAAGKHSAILEVPEFGRWSIAVESKTGVALQVVDRMAGAGEIAGVAGERDGRIDLFLDRGEVKIVARGAELGRGTAKLSARPFVERNGSESNPEPPRLVETRTVSTELADLEQRSYWIEVEKRRTILLEAAGRHLADLRIWRAGSWLEPTLPVISTIEPEVGRPMTLCQLAVDLEPGLYLATAYGGAGLLWSGAGGAAGGSGEEHPLHLRLGVERRGEAGRLRGRVGPFGVDRFLVPASADLFRLELARAQPFALEVAPFDPQQPLPALAAHHERMEITKESVPPVTELWRTKGEPAKLLLVSVSGAPGEPYVVQQLSAAKRIPIPSPGDFWVGSLHAGAAGDSIDATGVLVAVPTAGRSGDRRPRFEAASAVPLDRTRGWRRRFNLLESATLTIDVREAGDYEVAALGASVNVRIEPFLVSTPHGYEPPPMRATPASFALDSGLHVVTLAPSDAGIAEIAIRHRGLLDPLFDLFRTPDATTIASERSANPLRPMTQLGALALAPKSSYELWLNDQPGVTSGGLVRPLPLDLSDPLPVLLLPGGAVELPIAAAERGVVTATDEQGERHELSTDGVTWAPEIALAPGRATLRVRASGIASVVASVAFTSDRRSASSPLPPLESEAKATLPRFPKLVPGEPQRFDLDRRAARTFELDAQEAGLYVVETSGLLATEGALRTRVLPELVKGAENGRGRNAALRAYLREGRYQATVRARGKSAGHLGIELRRAALDAGGRLDLGLPARAELAADRALAYEFEITTTGDYRLTSLGLRGPVAGRLEEADGWPVGAPVVDGDLTLSLEPGRYRWIVLPRAVGFRVVTTIERVPEPVVLAGHGPHPLPLGVARQALWQEPQSGEPRTRDTYTFTLPAASCVALELSGEMQGELLRVDRPGDEPLLLRPGRTWRCGVEAGDYRIEVVNSRVDHRVPYTIAATPSSLVVGTEQTVELPAVVPVAVGRTGAIEIESFGGRDVRARLFDSSGALLHSVDDRSGDWNFLLAETLAAGTYRLEVEPVGSDGGTTRIAMRARPLRTEAAWTLPGQRPLELSADEHLLPIAAATPGTLVALRARADSPVRVAIEARATDSDWSPLTTGEGALVELFAPLAVRGEALRLRLRSLDRRAVRVELTGWIGALPFTAESEAATAIARAQVPGFDPPLTLAGVALDRAGCFELDLDDDRPLVAALAAPRGAAPATTLLDADGGTLWLGPDPPAALALRRITLRPGGDVRTLRLGARALRCDIEGEGSPVAVLARAQAGAPIVGLDALAPGAVALAPRRALTLLSSRASGALLAANAAGDRPIEAAIELRALDALPQIAFDGAALELELPAGALRTVRTGDGAAIDVLLERGTAIASGALGQTRAIEWAADSELALALTLDSGDGELQLVNLEDAPRRVRLERARGASPTPPLRCGARFEQRLAHATRLVVPVEPLAPGAICSAPIAIRGAATATLVSADGRVASGDSVPYPTNGGLLRIDARAGWIAADANEESAPVDALGFTATLPAQPITLPWRATGEERETAVRFELDAPRLVVVRAPGAAAIAVADAGRARRFALDGARLEQRLYLPAGSHELRLRALGDARLPAPLTIESVELVALAEGLGEATLLGAGDTRGYGFEIARGGPVGVGVAAADRQVETIVFDSAGRERGRGVVQWLELEPGRYALALAAAADSTPGLARPALVGASPPGTGPPPEVVRAFFELERGTAPVVEGIAGLEATPRFRPELGADCSDAEECEQLERDRQRRRGDDERCFDENGSPCERSEGDEEWDGEGEGEIE